MAPFSLLRRWRLTLTQYFDSSLAAVEVTGAALTATAVTATAVVAAALIAVDAVAGAFVTAAVAAEIGPRMGGRGRADRRSRHGRWKAYLRQRRRGVLNGMLLYYSVAGFEICLPSLQKTGSALAKEVD